MSRSAALWRCDRIQRPKGARLVRLFGGATGGYGSVAGITPSPAGDPEFAARRVTIAGANEQLTLTTERGARIDGRVEIESSHPPPALTGLQVIALEAELEVPNPGGPSAAIAPITVSDPDS